MVPPKADPLRVSQTVKRLNDQDGYQDTKGKPSQKRDDFELTSKDQELVFAAKDKKTNKTIEENPSNETEGLDKKDLPSFSDLKRQPASN